MRFVRSALVVVMCSALMGGCTGSHRSDEGGSVSPSAPGASSRDGGDRSAEALVKDGAILKATVHPIERAGDHVVLTVDYSFSKDSQRTTNLNMQILLGTGRDGINGVSTVRLLDFSGGRVWEAGRVGSARSATTQDPTLDRLALDRQDQTVTVVTFFAPVDADTVDVLIPKVGLVSDVAVVEGGSGTPGLASLGVGDGPVTYDPPVGLESLVRAYQGDASATKQGDEQTVVMASDVLFASDSADLSEEAGARVDEVAAQIAQVASGGEVRVVGHTDDVASAEYNMDLSVRRATSVADRMAPVLGSSFTVVKEGKGKTEPAVVGTDAQARAANRRVEIEFTAQKAVTLPKSSADVPDATGPVGNGHDPVTYTLPGGYAYKVEVPSVVRRDGYLVGTFVVSSVSGVAPDEDFLSDNSVYSPSCSGQSEYRPMHGANCVTLMGPQGQVFPIRYQRPGNDAAILADTYLPYFLSDMLKEPNNGDSFTYTVVWSDTGQDSVTVDSSNRFRIIDIPVEEG